MKRFFALFTIVALLAVAGSAFAANPTVTANPSSVTITAGGSETVSLSATTPNNGTITWTVSGGGLTTSLSAQTGTSTTLTISAPASVTEATPYTVTVTANERWSDAAGHTGANGSATIAVTVNPAYTPDPPAPTPSAGGISTEVDPEDQAAILALGDDGDTIEDWPEGAVFGTSDYSSTSEVIMEDGTTAVCVLPKIEGLPNSGTHTYLVEVTFGTITETLSSVPVLYPNGPEDGDAVEVKLYAKDSSGSMTRITDQNVNTYVYTGATAFMKFKISDGAFVSNASLGQVYATLSMTNPVLGATVKSGGTNNPGKSSGGCDAGFTALALAVLGGFIATRRK